MRRYSYWNLISWSIIFNNFADPVVSTVSPVASSSAPARIGGGSDRKSRGSSRSVLRWLLGKLICIWYRPPPQESPTHRIRALQDLAHHSLCSNSLETHLKHFWRKLNDALRVLPSAMTDIRGQKEKFCDPKSWRTSYDLARATLIWKINSVCLHKCCYISSISKVTFYVSQLN